MSFCGHSSLVRLYKQNIAVLGLTDVELWNYNSKHSSIEAAAFMQNWLWILILEYKICLALKQYKLELICR